MSSLTISRIETDLMRSAPTGPGRESKRIFGLAGVTFGSLLGVFLLGLLTTRRVKDGANVAAMIVMALVNLALLVLSEMKVLAFGWSWLVVLGTVGTILLALTFSATARRDSSRPS